MTSSSPRTRPFPREIRVSDGTKREIDQHVEKVLRGLGNPPPPLDLREVRELLRLDMGYYSSGDDSALREKLSKLRVAGKQVLARPGLLVDAVRKHNLRALYLPDRKRILLDEDMPKKKHRWSEAHEVGHSLLDWHHETMLGDTESTLTPLCRAHIEAEANFAAGRLLFLGARFDDEIVAHPPTIASVQALAATYGNSITSTLWRMVEQYPEPVQLVGLVSDHPRYSSSNNFAGESPVRHSFFSRTFLRKVGHVANELLWTHVQSYSSYVKRGPLGQAEVFLASKSGELVPFVFETFYNGYDALTLGVNSLRKSG